MIHIENLCFSHPPVRKPLFENLNLTIESQCHTSIMGPDGAGKTTLGKLIKGLLVPKSGSIRNTFTTTGKAVLVAYVGADPDDNLVGITVEDDIIFGLENLCLSNTDMLDRLALSTRWTGLTGMEKRLTRSLSGGERQKVALAAVLAIGAQVVIFDEAFSMLDPAAGLMLRECIKSLIRTRETTVIEITNDPWHILASDRIIYLDQGHVRFDGGPALFLASKEGQRWLQYQWGVPRLMKEIQSLGQFDASCRETRHDTQAFLIEKIAYNT
jgi:energy-coupling factor transport system ATP-binding protein